LHFLISFLETSELEIIKKIWIDYPLATIEYTIPLNKKDNLSTEVLVYAKSGSPALAHLKLLKLFYPILFMDVRKGI